MRAFLMLASLSVLVTAEPPTGYTHRSSSGDLNFQSVPSVAQIHIPPSAAPRSISSSSSSASSSSGGVTASSTSQIARYAVPPQSVTAAAAASPSGHHLHHQTTAYSSPQAVYAAPTSSQSQQSTVYASPSQQTTSYSPPSQQATAYTSAQPASAYSSPQASYGGHHLQSFAFPQVQIQAQPQYAAQHLQAQASNQQYSLPQQQFGTPSNVQVNYGAPPPLPPGASYGPPPVITGAGPEHNIEYRVVYVKGPKAPKPDLVLPPPPPKQKTIVYILIPRVEAPDPIIVPTHAPTPPSKPEVYFIRYKAKKNNKQSSTSSILNSVPSSDYGSPFAAASGPRPVIVEAPSNRKRSTESLTTTTAKTTTTTAASPAESVTAPSSVYGERVRKLH